MVLAVASSILIVAKTICILFGLVLQLRLVVHVEWPWFWTLHARWVFVCQDVKQAMRRIDVSVSHLNENMDVISVRLFTGNKGDDVYEN